MRTTINRIAVPVNIVAIVVLSFAAAGSAIVGNLTIAALDAFGAALNVACLFYNVARIQQRNAAALVTARRPDYALIASIEREVYGEAFHHGGSPVADAVDTFARDAAENAARLSDVRRRLPDGHADGYCAKCHELDWRHR